MVRKKQDDTRRGGARDGAGRRSLYKDPLTRIIAVQLDEEQSNAIIAYARRNRYNITFLLREVALIAANASKLGVGLDSSSSAPGWAEPREMTKLPLKFTEPQHEAVTRAATKLDMTARAFVLEAALAYIGRSKLGEQGEIEKRSRALTKLPTGERTR